VESDKPLLIEYCAAVHLLRLYAEHSDNGVSRKMRLETAKLVCILANRLRLGERYRVDMLSSYKPVSGNSFSQGRHRLDAEHCFIEKTCSIRPFSRRGSRLLVRFNFPGGRRTNVSGKVIRTGIPDSLDREVMVVRLIGVAANAKNLQVGIAIVGSVAIDVVHCVAGDRNAPESADVSERHPGIPGDFRQGLGS
jgi:hypothetical protein